MCGKGILEAGGITVEKPLQGVGQKKCQQDLS
jgi:hypothetical protein